jgi:hypothetical protein
MSGDRSAPGQVSDAPQGRLAQAAPTRAPDFYIVGQPKSGTTAMYEMLRTHPQVFMPDFKEPRYFARDLPSQFQEPRVSGLAAETYGDYLSLFAPAAGGQLTGEASTAYIWSEVAAREIASARPDAKIIALFREPASYVRSMHLQLLEIRTETSATLREALALEDARRAGRELPRNAADWPKVLFYRDRVRYLEQLRRYHEAFPREQVLVLLYDDFRADNAGTMRSVMRFLGVDENVVLTPSEANPSARMRSVKLDEAVRSVTAGASLPARASRRVAKALLPSDARESVRRMLSRGLVFGSPKPPEEDVMLELRRACRQEVRAFGEYIGRDLVALWGYDRLD